MTFETIDTTKNESMTILCAEPTRPAPSLKAKIQPWLKLFIACVCLTQGLRFLYVSDAIGTLIGLALMVPIPSCCYLCWRDYRGLKQARDGRVNLRTRRLLSTVQ